MKKKWIMFFLVFSGMAIGAQETDSEAPVRNEEPVSFSLTDRELDDLSVWYQQEEFIRDSRVSSFFIPGKGQFMNNENLSGALYLTGSLGVQVLTWTVAYLMLPPDLMFGNINPLTDKFSVVEQKLKAHSFRDFLPSVSVLLTGALIHTILGFFSSRDAERLARQKIASGEISFVPDTPELLRNLLHLSR